jgi:serine/threonine protein kinase
MYSYFIYFFIDLFIYLFACLFYDFIWSKLQDKNGPKGTFLWMAPEVMNEEEFDRSLDVYSFGLILLETWYVVAY